MQLEGFDCPWWTV